MRSRRDGDVESRLGSFVFDTATPITKNVSIVTRDNQQNVLARWELTGVTPATFSSSGAGILTEVDATVEFAYQTLTLVQAKPD